MKIARRLRCPPSQVEKDMLPRRALAASNFKFNIGKSYRLHNTRAGTDLTYDHACCWGSSEFCDRRSRVVADAKRLAATVNGTIAVDDQDQLLDEILQSLSSASEVNSNTPSQPTTSAALATPPSRSTTAMPPGAPPPSRASPQRLATPRPPWDRPGSEPLPFPPLPLTTLPSPSSFCRRQRTAPPVPTPPQRTPIHSRSPRPIVSHAATQTSPPPIQIKQEPPAPQLHAPTVPAGIQATVSRTARSATMVISCDGIDLSTTQVNATLSLSPITTID